MPRNAITMAPACMGRSGIHFTRERIGSKKALRSARLLLCTQVLRSARVPTLLRKAFPQKRPIFPAFCQAKTFFSRFFSHSANIAGICCVVIIMGFPPRLSNLGAASHDDRPRCQATLRLGLP